ncbi:peroxidase family protein [Aestuariivirga sp.]|uniref:peroxidase family protein n=1 Tax=Aestuariivirga sp. TaxID=2650926 RepID=UPI0039E2347E
MTITDPSLKPFVIDNTDIQFLLDQVNFIPLFDAAGNVIINWDGTGRVYNAYGRLLATGGTVAGDAAALAAIALVGTSYQNTTDLSGLRDPSGFNNNLTPIHAHWGQAGFEFPRTVPANFTNYAQEVLNVPADTVFTPLAPEVLAHTDQTSLVSVSNTQNTSTSTVAGITITKNVTDELGTGTTISTASVLNKQVKDGHHKTVTITESSADTTVTTSTFVYDKVTTVTTIGNGGPTATSTDVNITQTAPVVQSTAVTHGPTTTSLSGGELDTTTSIHFATDGKDHLAHSFKGLVSGTVGTQGTYRTITNGVTTAADYHNPWDSVVDYTPRMISRTTTTADVQYDTWANHQNDANASKHMANEIYYDPNTGVAKVLDWGQLKTVADGGLGQVDTQARLNASAGQDDHFIGGLNPGVSPSNGFFVLFGQFFDHGLDFIDKGGQGSTIQIALAVDDPLYGMIGPDGNPVTSITINRATVDSVSPDGTPQYVNHTSPFIDQSQTYGSNSQLTTLLREWVKDANGGTGYHAGMSMFDGHTLETAWKKPDGTMTNATLPTLAELRQHIVDTGRDDLSWEDISNLRNRDAAGHVTTGLSGSALILDMNPRFDIGHLHGFNDKDGDGVKDANEISYATAAQVAKVDAAIAALDADVKATYGNGAGLSIQNGILTLSGIPGPNGPMTLTGASALYPWVDFSNFSIMQTHAGTINASISSAAHAAVGEILMASVGDHYIAGDGRVNENFGLTSVHHIFHEEHNFQVQNLIEALHTQDVATNDTAHTKLHGFQIATTRMNSLGDYVYVAGSLTQAKVNPTDVQIFGTNGNSLGYAVASNVTVAWDDEKMFNATKLIVEMEYQHAAVDQYARNVTPNIQEFVGYSPDKDPGVTLEYAQGAFRFGHSTLRETIDTIDPTGGLTGKIMGYALRDAFLNPGKYGELGPASILLGMSHQQMNEVDEFVTPALNQGLLGQPLDLAAINIARGRDIGLPTLNDFREAIGLVRYTSWTDFGQNMQHPTSLANFIAAYSFDGDMDRAKAIVGLADGSIAEGSAAAMGMTAVAALAFLDGGDLGFNKIDTWLGGLAEIHQPGGILGETFDKVFVTQIESLMDGDRFYYLYRLAGQQFGQEVANGQLKDIVERNTGLTHLNGNIFGYADQYVDLAAKKEVVGPNQEALTTGNEHKYGNITAVDSGAMGVYSNGGLSNANDGNTISLNTVDGLQTYIQDTRLADTDPNSLYGQNGFVNLDGTPNSGAESNEVIAGTKGNDMIYAQGGDDTVYGDGGNDILYGGYGIDRLYGGTGADTIFGGDNPDLIDGGAGDDKLYGESSGTDINGSDQVIGGSGNDYIDGGTGIDKLTGGSGDDHIVGGQDTDPFTHGDDGNDIVEGNSGGDILYGDNGDDLVIGGADQDQLFGNNGDDILRPGDPTGALTIGTDEVLGGDGVDVNDTGFDLIDFSDNTARPGGVTFDVGNQQNPNVTVNGTPVQLPSFQIDGVIGSVSDDTLTGSDSSDAGNGADASIAGKNWLIGGTGNDTLQGSGGNDLIIGGSIRLDTLIGTYKGVQYDANGIALKGANGQPILTGFASTYDHNNNNWGLTSDTALMDARYQGASHRVGYADVLSGGLLGGAGVGAGFERHFADMLRSDQFKDAVLGDGGADTASSDTAVYTGNMSRYTIVALDINGNVVSNPHTNWGSVFAVKITDNRTANEFIDNAGNPLLDANGNPLVNEGTDIVVGVEKLKFADQTISPEVYFDKAPKLDLNFNPIVVIPLTTDNFSGNNVNVYARGTAWAGNWSESGDGNGQGSPASGQIMVDAIGSGVATNLGLHITGGIGNAYNGATVSRGVDLTGVESATVSFDVRQTGIGGNETVRVYVLDHTPGNGDVPLYTIQTGADSAATNHTFNIPSAMFNANARVYFVASSMSAATDNVFIDNITVTKTADTSTSNTASYTELSAAAAITTTPKITDPDATDKIYSAKIVIRETVAGDHLTMSGSLPSGIVASGVGTGVITLTSAAGSSMTDFETALKSILFSNDGPNPTNYGQSTSRHIDVTVNDRLLDSPVATTTVNITAIDNASVVNNDTVVTNFAANTNIAIADWTLLANDSDVDTILRVSSIGNPQNGVTLVGQGLGHSNGSATTTVRDVDGGSGAFSYTLNTGPTATVNLVQQTSLTTLTANSSGNILLGTDAITTFLGGAGKDVIVTNGGNDTVTAGGEDDIISYTVTTGGGGGGGGGGTVTSGRDIIDGGAQGSAGDRFILNGSNGAETFRIFSNTDDWDNNAANGIQSSAAHAGITGLNANTKIVITRNGTFANGVLTGGTVLAELNNIEEITVNTLDVSANDGNGVPNGGTTGGFNGDTVQIVGNFTNTGLNYSTITINGGADDKVDIGGLTSAHRIVFNGAASTDQVIGTLRPQDVVNTVGAGNAPAQLLHEVIGTDRRETLAGTADDDLIDAKRGNDTAKGGDGHDHFVGAFGDGNDKYYGEGGNDLFTSVGSDGRDFYDGGEGSDTLDMSGVTNSIVVKLVEGANGSATIGSVVDTLVSIENVRTGSGNDTIYASTAHNYIDTGAGHDTVVFLTAAHANDDVIDNFEAGDVIDLKAFMGGTINLVQGEVAQNGEVAWHFDNESGNTEVHGVTSGGTHFDFEIRGDHKLTTTDFGM